MAEHSGPLGVVRDFLDGLRFPYLFLLAAGLFLVDMVVIDPIPFLDEIFLAVVTLLVARIKERTRESKDVTPKP